jgi:hypothetical protein
MRRGIGGKLPDFKMNQIKDLQKGLMKMISKNGKGDNWFLKKHMNKIPKTTDSTLSRTGTHN